MDDYISREAALKAICDKQRDHTHWKSNYELGKYQGANGYVDAINAVPAADVRPVARGKWLMPNADKTDRPMPECSVCGWYVTEGAAMEFTFCPNCGADMREEK